MVRTSRGWNTNNIETHRRSAHNKIHIATTRRYNYVTETTMIRHVEVMMTRQKHIHKALLFCIVLLSSCAPSPSQLLAPGGTQRPGEKGVFGAHVFHAHVQVNITASAEIQVYYPSTRDGAFDTKAAPAPVVLFLQGGAVSVSRYNWLLQHLASRGHVVLAPQHILNAAILQGELSTAARQAYTQWVQTPTHLLHQASSSEPMTILMGHSLGGITGAKLYLKQKKYQGLAVLGSYILPEEPLTSHTSRVQGSILLLTGARDGVIIPQKTRDTFSRLSASAYLGLVEGMTHYDWCDEVTDAEQTTDTQPQRPTKEVRIPQRSCWIHGSKRSSHHPNSKNWSVSNATI
ncbi:MAG: hypothetical protein CL920_01800 [Deltaproteobacteria bacterium]|nr:hypothetical protein [Deltaproteobacteria bacterium]